MLVVLGYCWEFALRDEVRLEFQAVTAQQLQDTPADVNTAGGWISSRRPISF